MDVHEAQPTKLIGYLYHNDVLKSLSLGLNSLFYTNIYMYHLLGSSGFTCPSAVMKPS